MPALRPDPDDTTQLTRPDSLWPDSWHAQDESRRPGAAGRYGAAEAALGRRLVAAGSSPAMALCRPAIALRVVLLVQAVVALAVLPGTGSAGQALLQVPGPLCAALGASLVWLPALCALQAWLARRGPALQALLASAAGALAALAGWLLTLLLGVAAGGGWAAATAALAGAGVALALWTWLALRLALARPADARARLAELQSRIRPHFLFNALNTALALVRADPARAELVLEDLSALFRAALAEDGSAVTLDDEIDLAQRYLAIEKLRFADRLQLRWDLDPEAGFARVPPLVLQPLVENAVRHGIEPAARGGLVRVTSRVRRGLAEIEVVNTLPQPVAAAGVDGESGEAGAAATGGHGMALANVRERLRLLHDLAGTLDTRVADGCFHARITVPM
ncbi:MAG: histidine kinase [Burkholderiaceae bacterium]|nr:histidine kinase [Burkholderiaceae bacterium]